MRHSPSRAFSLVEILIVIAVVAVLLSLLLPSISMARELARRTRCQANLRTLIISSIAMSNDNKGVVPYGAYGTGSQCSFYGPTRKDLYDDYGASNPLLWWCPSGIYRDEPDKWLYYKLPKWYMDETFNPSGLSWSNLSVQNNNRDRTGYAYFVGPGRGHASNATPYYDMPYLNKFRLSPSPSTRIVWADPLKAPGLGNGGGGVWTVPSNTHDTKWNYQPLGSNNAMVDGHVEWRKYIFGVTTNWWGASEGAAQYYIYR